MPTTDKFSKKVVSTTIINGQPNDFEHEKLLVKSVETADAFEQELSTDIIESLKKEGDDYQVEYVWRNIIFFIVMHILTVYAFYTGFMRGVYYIFFWHSWLGYMAGLGVTAGAHRLWSHQAYKAHWTVRLFLAFWFTMAGQNDIHEWCRDHRVHHKWSETHADPHNATRGFFFSHMGWLLVKKHKLVMVKGATLNYDDLLKDPIVRFHKKYYKILYVLCVYLIPTYATVVLFRESWFDSFAQSMARYCFSLHITWLVNSAAHMYGYRPYNDKINPRESPWVIYSGLLGEGFHNYHHSFPSDYRASEFGVKQLNLSCVFIETMAKYGLAWDLKKPNEKVVEAAKRRVKENEEIRELTSMLKGDGTLLKEQEIVIETISKKDH